MSRGLDVVAASSPTHITQKRGSPGRNISKKGVFSPRNANKKALMVAPATNILSMTEYDRRAGLPSANYAQFCLELIAFVASHPVLRDESRNEQLLAWMEDAADADRRQ